MKTAFKSFAEALAGGSRAPEDRHSTTEPDEYDLSTMDEIRAETWKRTLQELKDAYRARSNVKAQP